jgi:sterol desaturase/sphingolipid hydroxylase (fatty acid hydroxylase superfamily)
METLNKLLAIDANYILIGFLVIFFTIEQIINTPFNFSKRPRHLFHSLMFQIVLIICNIFFVVFQVYCIEWLNNHYAGLLYLFHVPLLAKLFIGVVFYDLTTYFIHRVTHKVPLLWRFHRVHHSDTSPDSSSNFRFHPIESILVFGIGYIITAAVFGTNVLSLALYSLVLTTFSFLEHSNIETPSWIDKTLGLVFVTPNLHKVHHEQDQFYTDSNFADIFILWDRIFGTYKHKPLKGIKYGLQEFDEDRKQTFWYLIRSPFMNVKRISSEELQQLKHEQDEKLES